MTNDYDYDYVFEFLHIHFKCKTKEHPTTRRRLQPKLSRGTEARVAEPETFQTRERPHSEVRLGESRCEASRGAEPPRRIIMSISNLCRSVVSKIYSSIVSSTASATRTSLTHVDSVPMLVGQRSA